jgi:hypothetical protein
MRQSLVHYPQHWILEPFYHDSMAVIDINLFIFQPIICATLTSFDANCLCPIENIGVSCNQSWSGGSRFSYTGLLSRGGLSPVVLLIPSCV